MFRFPEQYGVACFRFRSNFQLEFFQVENFRSNPAQTPDCLRRLADTHTRERDTQCTDTCTHAHPLPRRRCCTGAARAGPRAAHGHGAVCCCCGAVDAERSRALTATTSAPTAAEGAVARRPRLADAVAAARRRRWRAAAARGAERRGACACEFARMSDQLPTY